MRTALLMARNPENFREMIDCWKIEESKWLIFEYFCYNFTVMRNVHMQYMSDRKSHGKNRYETKESKEKRKAEFL